MIERIRRRFQGNPWLADVLAFLAGVLYFVQAWSYAHIQTSFVDEGGYLYVGNLYAEGILKPFQDYAIPRWYAPLSYLIPGQIEKWFGASLLTGRLFSVACGLLMLIPLWIIARRFAGKWWGMAMVWGMALTPVSIQIYSLALSQALVACLLAWSLACVLGEKRPLWQIAVGSILAGLVVMTRQNMFPVVPLLVAYVFWQHGKKSGWWALAGSLLPILVIHVIYWPNILQLWAIWLPSSLTPFLDSFRFPAASLVSESSNIGISSRLLAFLQSFRYHYFTMLGFIVCIFLWPHKNAWKSQASKRAAYFLAILFAILCVLHIWATLISSKQADTCTFCFTPYLAFFDITALLLIAVTAPSWRKDVSKITQGCIIFLILLLSSGLGYATFDRFGSWVLNVEFPAFTRGLDPRRWVPFITLWDILANKFHLDYWESRAPVATIAGLILGILLLILGKIIYKNLSKRRKSKGYSFSALFLIAALGLGIWLSPLMVGTYREAGVCVADIPETYEQMGETLARTIPAGSQVYWEAKTAVPLLYAPGIKIYAPQVYGTYSFRLDGDPDQLSKYGLWNEELAKRWRSEADFIVTEVDWSHSYRPGGDLNTGQFEEFHTVPANPCDPYSYLIIYKRKP